jgi:hypothetical protein
VQSDGGSKYGYTNPKAGKSTTAIGLLCRIYLGYKPQRRAIAKGIAEVGAKGPSEDNPYYNYYATLLLKEAGGKNWENWIAALRQQLLNSQEKLGDDAGTWFANGGEVGKRAGRLGVTSLSLIALLAGED